MLETKAWNLAYCVLAGWLLHTVIFWGTTRQVQSLVSMSEYTRVIGLERLEPEEFRVTATFKSEKTLARRRVEPPRMISQSFQHFSRPACFQHIVRTNAHRCAHGPIDLSSHRCAHGPIDLSSHRCAYGPICPRTDVITDQLICLHTDRCAHGPICPRTDVQAD